MSFASFDPDMTSPAEVNVRCHGCKREMRMEDYWSHRPNCERPRSGETFL